MKKQKWVRVLTRAEELEILEKQFERIKKDPSIGIKLAQKAGILDERGELTEYYRTKE